MKSKHKFGIMRLSVALLAAASIVAGQGTSIPNTLSHPRHRGSQTVQALQGIHGTNFNDMITFYNFKEKSWELNAWNIIPVTVQSADSDQSQYNRKGALLYGGTYMARDGSVMWKGLGFSANGPCDTAFALGHGGKQAKGYYTFIGERKAITPAGETGPWILYYLGQPTA